MQKSFTFDLKMYIVPALFLATGYIVHMNASELVWLYRATYAIGLFSLIIMILHHHTVYISKEAIQLSYIWGKEVLINKGEIRNFRRKTTFSKVERVEWFFNLTSGKTIHVINSMKEDEKGIIEAINDFCIGLELIKD